MHRDFPMPERLLESARAWLDSDPLLKGASGQRDVSQRPEPVPAKLSATVMLLRPGAQGPEVFVLRRATTMAFAADMLAFPGGGVDVRDADPDVPWTGPGPHEWAERMRTSVDRARELVIAAAREVFEECGVLLAGPDARSVVRDLTAAVWDDERDALLAREQSFAELLIRRKLVLRTDLLGLRAHWITPEAEPKRFDTQFFVARLPEGQVADDRSSEASRVHWAAPRTLLAEHDRGEHIMLPPTRVMIEQLARAEDLEEALAPAGEVWPVMPWPAEHSGEIWMRAPIDELGHGLPPASALDIPPTGEGSEDDTPTGEGPQDDTTTVEDRRDETPTTGDGRSS